MRVTVVLVLLVAFASPRPVAAEDSPELRARTHFAAGEYKEALDLYARLYAETLHPTYLRNIARCHQNLGDPDKAISSFREYLRKAKDLPADQRAEIEGYIAEMEQLKRSRTAPPAAPPPATADSPALLAPATVTANASDEGTDPFYTKVWFWVVVGAVVAGGVTAGLLLSADPTPPGHGNVGLLDLSM